MSPKGIVEFASLYEATVNSRNSWTPKKTQNDIMASKTNSSEYSLFLNTQAISNNMFMNIENSNRKSIMNSKNICVISLPPSN